MSKVAIAGNASGTGTFTIAAPNSNTDRTLTLPDNAGTILTSASSLPAANLTGSLPAGMGGKLLQIVSASWSSSAALSSTTLVDIGGLSLSITPASSSNKVLLLLIGGDIITNASSRFLYTTFLRNSTNLAPNTDYLSHYGDYGAEEILAHSMSFLDSPSTTSSVTYKVQAKVSGGAVYFANQTRPVMLAMEIAA